MSMMPLVTLLMLPPLKPRLTSMMSQAMLQSPTSTRSPSPLLPHLLSLTPPTLTPTVPTPMLDTPTPLLPTTPAVSTTLAALCPAPKRLYLNWDPKTDGGPQRTEDDWRTRTGYWRTLCRTNG